MMDMYCGDEVKGEGYILNLIFLKSASYINGNLNGRKELEHYAS